MKMIEIKEIPTDWEVYEGVGTAAAECPICEKELVAIEEAGGITIVDRCPHLEGLKGTKFALYGLWVEELEKGNSDESLCYEYRDGNKVLWAETADTDKIRTLLELSNQL